ncbi:M28 family peptidase [Knoellia aerolata]|uniref:Peptidase M28 domain-containing protein n=1 Tax=Knoellia aerolata DSM 18566 TaxID=1385519 RepID=A0A0A0JV54_9MICO|nr:M28 family peptidase [Knoellia aerolata]KGN40579.1 hypothetical protein N801_01765 [Knoellia aerolata DSM 18566]
MNPRRRRRDVTQAPTQPTVGVLLMVAALGVAALVGVSPLRSPAEPAGDTSGGFSLERARDDLAVVAAAPHPMGTAEQATVEAYLVRELRALGLEPEVDSRRVTMAPDAPRSVWTGTVRNVVARLGGVGPGADQAVLLAAHHDSVPTSAGAGDNGAGVVSVLAAMRSLTAGPPPRNDVIVAFVDGEEHEMLGALALVESAEWMRDVRVVVNTEGVGNAGRVTPALTSPRNGWALRQYLDAAPSPIVHTAFAAPLNATGQGADLGRYQEVVPAGLELVVVGGLPAYHSGLDTAAAMHPGTLAEYGTTVVRLAERLATTDLDTVRAPNLVAFTLLDGLTVAYPSTWSPPLAVLAALAVALTVGVATRRGRVAARRVVLSWLVLGVAGLSGVLAATALWLGARVVDPRLSDAVNGGVHDRTAYVLAAVAAGAAGVLVVVWPLRRRSSALEVVAGALVGSALVALLLAAVLPDAAYAVTWPLLAATAGFAFLVTGERSSRAVQTAVTLAALPAVLLLSPLVALYFMLSARFELILPVATPLPMLWVVLGLTVVVPLVLVGRERVGWRPAAATGALAVAAAGVGVATSALGGAPRPSLLVHHVDADAGTARWVALPQELDAHTGQVGTTGWTPTRFEASPFHQPGATRPGLSAPAPMRSGADVSPPAVTVTRDTTTPAGRELVVDVAPGAGRYAVTVDLRSAGGIRSVAVHGERLDEATSGSPSSVRVVAFSPGEDIPLRFTVPTGADVQLALAAYTTGFDGSPAVRPRGTGHTTAVHEVPDGVLVTSVVDLRDPS